MSGLRIARASMRAMGLAMGMLLASTSASWAVAEAEPDLGEESAAAVEEETPPTAVLGETPPAASAGHVARSAFTQAVVDREPTDTVHTLTNDVAVIAYFTELRELAGQRVVHRWSHGGEVVTEVAFDVAGPRWRVHSTKKLDPSWLGEWSVAVIDAEGRTLSEESFRYTAPTPANGAPE